MVSKIRVVHYPRVSSDKQAKQGDSIEAQEKRLNQHSEINEHEVIGVYTDAGKSASISDDEMEIFYHSGKITAVIDISKRQGMMRILDELKKNSWDAIKITKWDRFSRNSIFSKIVQIYFTKNNKFIIPTDDSEDPLMIEIKGALSQEEVRKMKSRVRETRLLRFERGDMVAKAPFGYYYDTRKKKMLIDEKKSHIVKKVFDLTFEGYSYKQICALCDLKPQSYYNIIKNKVYIGIIEFEGIYRKGNHEPIISEELFNKVQIPKTKQDQRKFSLCSSSSKDDLPSSEVRGKD
jgi:site-specific DNA recombinase